MLQHVEVGPVTSTSGKQVMKLSSVFPNNGEIPRKYTCHGDSISPPLTWSDVPAEARSLVLIVEDDDAVDENDRPHPDRPWVHWVLYNIPPPGLREGGDGFQLPPQTLEGVNGRGETGYFPYCPPSGPPHHYFHRLWALDLVLDDLARPSKAALVEHIRRRRRADRSRIIASANLVGTYPPKAPAPTS
jgi:Raf kinase inhibitor-like YbhB/YbcL family protein